LTTQEKPVKFKLTVVELAEFLKNASQIGKNEKRGSDLSFSQFHALKHSEKLILSSQKI